MKVKRKRLKLHQWKWLIIYLMSIIVFAYIYKELPSHFYHMTTQYEPQLERLCNRVKRSVEKELKESFKIKYPEGFMYIDDAKEWICYVEKIYVSDFSHEANMPYITLGIDLIRSNSPEMIGGENNYESIHTEIKIVLQKSYSKIANGVMLAGKVYRESLTEDLLEEMNLDEMNYEELFAISSTQNLVGMRFSEQTFTQIRNYNMAARGFPVNLEGSFFRMLYLSMITITGLGFGDIVPITNVARTLIGVEAVWGVVLLALFGNDVMKYKT